MITVNKTAQSRTWLEKKIDTRDNVEYMVCACPFILIINALTVQIPRHNTFLLLTLDTSCYPVGTHKHDRHLELHYANDTTLNKETTHSKAVINLKKLLKLLYNTSRMKQVLMLRYKSTKCSKHYEYINGKKSQFTTWLTFFLI